MLMVLVMDFPRVLLNAAFTKEAARIIAKGVVPTVRELAYPFKFGQ